MGMVENHQKNMGYATNPATSYPTLHRSPILNLQDHPRTCKWLVAPIYKPFI